MVHGLEVEEVALHCEAVEGHQHEMEGEAVESQHSCCQEEEVAQQLQNKEN